MDKKAVAEIKKLYKEATGVINNSDNKNYDRASDEVKQAIAALKALAEQGGTKEAEALMNLGRVRGTV